MRPFATNNDKSFARMTSPNHDYVIDAAQRLAGVPNPRVRILSEEVLGLNLV